MHRFLLEWLPIIVFVGVYFLGDLYVATMALVATSTCGWVWCKLRRYPLHRMHEYSVYALWVFGGLTILLRDPLFIIWKPTVVNSALALGLFINAQFAARPLLRRAFDSVFDLSDAGWVRFQWSWCGFLLFLAAVNLFVAYTFSEAIWVQYKLLGSMSLTVVFMLGLFWALRHRLCENLRIDRHSSAEQDQS